MTPADFIHHNNPTPGTHYACREGYDFAMQYATMADVWEACQRPDWLLWMYGRSGKPMDDRGLRLFACWCADSTPGAAPLTDPRSIEAVRVARLFAEGKASASELAAAARSAESAAEWAAESAESAAEAVVWSAAEWTSESAVEYAVWAAAEWAAWAAEAAAKSAQADKLREYIENPFK